MQPGQSYQRTLSFFAPEQTGDYWIVIEANSGGLLTEAEQANGEAVSTQAVDVLPSYTATVQADSRSGRGRNAGAALRHGDDGRRRAGAYQLVNIHIFTGGTEQIISAVTDLGRAVLGRVPAAARRGGRTTASAPPTRASTARRRCRGRSTSSA